MFGIKNIFHFLVVFLLIYTINGNVNVAWDPVTTNINGDTIVIDHYEVQLVRDVTGETRDYGTVNTSISISKPKSGVWMVRVRAVKLTQEGLPVYGEYCESTNPACATPDAWKIRWKPGGVVGPIIIK